MSTQIYKLGFAINAIARLKPNELTIIICGSHAARFLPNTYYVVGRKQVFKPEDELTNQEDWERFNQQLDEVYQLSCLNKFVPRWVKQTSDNWLVSVCNTQGYELSSYSCKISQLPFLGQSVGVEGGEVVVKSINKETAIQRMVVYGEYRSFAATT